jgi:hypothetical protein
MTRRPVAFAVLALVVGILALDLSASAPLNPYQAPPLLALGSGLAASGAHCAAAPAQ